MAALATQADVEASLLRVLTAGETTYVAALLARASRAVRVYTGQYIEQVTETVTVEPDLYGNLRLPQIPVTAVASITAGGTLVDAATYEWDSRGHITGVWGDPFEYNTIGWIQPVAVNNTHGYATIPDDIKEIVADIVAGRLSSASASSSGGTVKRAEVDDVVVEYDTAASALLGSDGLTEDHKAALDKYKQSARPINMLSRRVP